MDFSKECSVCMVDLLRSNSSLGFEYTLITPVRLQSLIKGFGLWRRRGGGGKKNVCFKCLGKPNIQEKYPCDKMGTLWNIIYTQVPQGYFSKHA